MDSLNMLLLSLVSHLSSRELAILMQPNNWHPAYLTALSVSFKPEPCSELGVGIESAALSFDSDTSRIDILRAIIIDPSPFSVTHEIPGFPTGIRANRLLARLTWFNVRLSSPSLFLECIVWNIVCIYGFERLGIEPSALRDPLTLIFDGISTLVPYDTLVSFVTHSPLIGIFNFSLRNQRRSVEATVVAHLLALAQAYYRASKPTVPSAQPCLLAVRWRRTGTPVYFVYTSSIPLSYLQAVEAGLRLPSVVISWQEFDGTDGRAMVGLVDHLLGLVPRLVMRVVEAAGGEARTRKLMQDDRDRSERDFRTRVEWGEREWLRKVRFGGVMGRTM